MVTKIEKEIGDMIEKNVDFNSIVHSSPNILRNPVNIRTNVIHALEEIGLVVQDNPNGSFRRFVRLICSDKNGTYYMFCKVVRLYKEPDKFVISVDHLYKAAEKTDPFSSENDVNLYEEYIKSILNSKLDSAFS